VKIFIKQLVHLQLKTLTHENVLLCRFVP